MRVRRGILHTLQVSRASTAVSKKARIDNAQVLEEHRFWVHLPQVLDGLGNAEEDTVSIS